MTDQWKQISGLYHAALKLPKDAQAAYLKEHAPDEKVRLELESLLAHEHIGEQLLEAAPTESAAGSPNRINIVLNWFEEVKQRVPVQ